MSHRFYAGEIFHRRFLPREHHFTYDYFFLDIDAERLEDLRSSLFGYNRAGIMSFLSHDHFGTHADFLANALELIASAGWEKPHSIRFITLPRIFHFVFNPISILLLLDEEQNPSAIVAEVHNYNRGRVLYPMKLSMINTKQYRAQCTKSMYVSPFMGYEGIYTFTLEYTPEHFNLRILLSEGNLEMLVAHFSGSSLPFSTRTIRTLLCNHTFLSLFVVTRTLWQSLRLKLKGLAWYPPRPQDQHKQEAL